MGLSVVSKMELGQSIKDFWKIERVAKSAELGESSGITPFHNFTYHQREKTSLGWNGMLWFEQYGQFKDADIMHFVPDSWSE